MALKRLKNGWFNHKKKASFLYYIKKVLSYYSCMFLDQKNAMLTFAAFNSVKTRMIMTLHTLLVLFTIFKIPVSTKARNFQLLLKFLGRILEDYLLCADKQNSSLIQLLWNLLNPAVGITIGDYSCVASSIFGMLRSVSVECIDVKAV